ncbi:MAG TPA: MMPL family transporter [Pilimelia sp.]|nr:MMPL family transporter [Pilimelia sp.]
MRTRVAVVAALTVVLGWLAVGAVAGPYSGKLSDVATNDNSAFLPADAEATRAQELTAGFIDRPTIPALVVYERTSGITEADRAVAAADAERFASVAGVVGRPSPPLPSDDGQALQVVVSLDESTGLEVGPAVEQLREIVSADRNGLTVNVTGPAGFTADLVAVFETIDVTLLLVTAAVVLVILLIVYRSPVLWIIPLLSAGVSFALAAALVYLLADADIIALNGQAQGILTVLVFGAGTDYALLLIARYREELRRHPRTVDAMKAAWRGAAPAIVASAGTVIASLLCLLLSGLNSNRALGPVSAVGIAATLLVMLTFLPALLLLGGRWIFWPRVPAAGSTEPVTGLWGRVAALVARRARPLWIGTAVVLAACAFGLTQIGATQLGQSDLFTGDTDSVAGQEVISRHYAGGAGSPATIIAAAGAIDRVTAAARGVAGVTDVTAVPAADGPPGAPPAGPPKVVDGRVQLQATLEEAPDSPAAERTVRELRTAVHAVPGADALVGGFTAVNIDTTDASVRDRNVIIPLVLAVIAVILALLLRSLLAPLLLIATVVLSFAATLGICALLFRHVFGFPGVDASFPLFAFVFLVALGIDYNIFLMSRVREEALQAGTREGVRRGLLVTGGVITSAGVVLAATFSALAVLPLVVLVELGVAVALGVLLDTIVVRSLLVPALATDLGRRIWWPGKLSRRTTEPAPDAELVGVP